MVKARRTRRQRQEDDDIRRIEERRLREKISYHRRRLLQDAREVSELFGPHLAVLFLHTPSDTLLFGNPTFDSVLHTLLPAADGAGAGTETETAEEAAARVAAMRREAEETEALAAAEQARLRAVVEKVKAAQAALGKEHWWEVDMEALGEAELPDFARALKALRDYVIGRLHKLAQARQPPQRQ